MSLFYTFLSIQESQISRGNSWLNMLGQLFLLIIALIIILFLSHYVTKITGSPKYRGAKNSNLKIIETISVGYQSSLQIIQVGDKMILIGVTKEKIEFICDINQESINKELSNVKFELPNSFQKYLDNFISKKNNDTKK